MSALLAGVGDLVVMRPLRHLVDRPADSMLQLLDTADLVVGNLEVPLTEINEPQKQGIVLRADPGLLADVAAAGLDVLSLANNHAADQGWPALAGLIERCTAAGMTAIGTGQDRAAAFAPRVREMDGVRVALVAATCVSLERFLASETGPGLAGIRGTTRYEADPERAVWEPGFPPRAVSELRAEDVSLLTDAITEAAQAGDLVLAVMHWGVSHLPGLAGYQRPLAAALVRAGARAVLGCHAHDLQGVEVIEGAPVFYGLGSFVFGYPGEGATSFPRDTAVALLEVGEGGRLTGARLRLGRLDSDGEPRLAGADRARHMAEQLERWSAGWGAVMELEGDCLTISLK